MSMSRPPQLPPRCPVKTPAVPQTQHSCVDVGSEDQPEWLNDLLGDTESNCKSKLHDLSLSELCDEDNGCGSYGPNSPRSKTNLCFPEKQILSALQNSISHLEVLPYNSSGDIYSQNKAVKRHHGQRSKARKLQYIAELEKAVDFLQNVASELAFRVASLTQQYAVLSIENDTLKRQLLRLQKEKFILDGEHQSLKKETERLKTNLVMCSKFDHSDAVFNILDLRKLDLN